MIRTLKSAGIVIVLITFFGVTPAYSASEKIQYRLHVQKGDSYKVRMSIQQNISQSLEEKVEYMSQTIGAGYTLNVEEVGTDGTAIIRVIYDSVQFKQYGKMGIIEYDSTKASSEPSPVMKGFSDFVGRSYSMKITPEGIVRDIQGLDTIIKHIMEKVDLPDGTMKVSLENNLKTLFGEQAIKEAVQYKMGVYTDKPVGIGDSWKRKFVLSTGYPVMVGVSKWYPIILETTNTLRERRNGISIIEEYSLVKHYPDAIPLEMGSAKISYDISGEQEGIIELQESTGLIIRCRLTQHLSGKVRDEAGSQKSEAMSWPISIERIISEEVEKI